MKKVLLLMGFMVFFSFSFAQETTTTVEEKKNPVMKAFEERKKKVVNLIQGDELTQKIKNLEENLSKIQADTNITTGVIEKIKNDIVQLNIEYSKIKDEISNLATDEEIKKAAQEYEKKQKELEEKKKELEDAIKSKTILLEKLQKQTEENKIQQEKLDLLLKQYVQQKKKEEEKKQTTNYTKYIIFFVVTFIHILVYFVSKYLYKQERLEKRTWLYINFFLLFGYTLFLIWFFFYLHPELSVFLLFISGYLLAINAHLIASFIGSVLILKRFQIGDIIKIGDFRGQIVKISTINTTILPVTKEGIFSNKPIIIPNVELLKNTVMKDETANVWIYEYTIKLPHDTKIDIMKMLEYIEQNILIKRLNNRLNTLQGSDDSFRTSIYFDSLGKISIKFVWKGDDVLNKQIERKIMGYVLQLKKEEMEEEERKKEEKEQKEKEEKEQKKKEEEEKFAKDKIFKKKNED